MNPIFKSLIPVELDDLFLLPEDWAIELTGSCKMKANVPGSDWDFFTPYVLEKERILVSNGFTHFPDSSRYSGNTCTESVWISRNGKIHIILVKEGYFEAFQKANEKCAAICKYMLSLGKADRKLLFAALLALEIEASDS